MSKKYVFVLAIVCIGLEAYRSEIWALILRKTLHKLAE